MTDLLFLSDLAQLGAVMNRLPHLLSRAHPVTSSLAVGAELERLGIPFSDELSYLEPQEIAHNLNLAYQLTPHWWDDELVDTQMLQISQAQAARQEWTLPFELCLNAGIAYRRLFAAKSVRRIYGFFFPSIGICRTGPAPAFQPATSVAQAVLLWFAHRAAILVAKGWRPPTMLQEV